jgi:hypothetical protein
VPHGIKDVTTVPREHEQQLAAAARTPDPRTVLARRDAAVARLRAARRELAAEIADIAAIEVFRETEWSLVHILTHLGADGGGHFAPVFAILDDGVRELPPFETRETKVAEGTAAAFAAIDRDIAFAEGLSEEQLLRHALRGGRPHYVIGFVEATADHVAGHVAQMRGIKRRLAEARERRQAVAAR